MSSASPSQPNPIPATNDAIEALGRHFPEPVREAYARFVQHREPGDADVVVMAIMLDHMPDKEAARGMTPQDSQTLVADLGFDSVAITEMVFFLEDLFHVRISNDEILRVKTVGDLRAFVRRKLTEPRAGNSTA
jgi:acyl carrier protein